MYHCSSSQRSSWHYTSLPHSTNIPLPRVDLDFWDLFTIEGLGKTPFNSTLLDVLRLQCLEEVRGCFTRRHREYPHSAMMTSQRCPKESWLGILYRDALCTTLRNPYTSSYHHSHGIVCRYQQHGDLMACCKLRFTLLPQKLTLHARVHSRCQLIHPRGCNLHVLQQITLFDTLLPL